MTSTHLSDIEMAAMADGNRSTRSIAEMQAHLAQCDDCRGLLVEAVRLADAPPQTRVTTGQFSWRMAGMAAAALLGIGLPIVYSSSISVRAPVIASERTAAVERPAIRTLMPGDVVEDPHRLRFAWSGEKEASYRLTLTDATGGPLWQTMTSDSTTVLPDDVQLGPGSRYYWYVDALYLDGSSVTSGRREFSTGTR